MSGKKILLILIAAAVLSPVAAQKVTKTGTTAAKFLSIGIGPRANAMGTAYSAVANDASAMYWNPSGIAGISQYQAVFTYTKMFADINVNYFGLVIPAGDIGVFGINVTALNVGEMDVTTEYYPEGTGEKFSAGSYAFGFTFAKFITQDFAVGATIKYIREGIYNSSADGFGIDIGTIYTTPFYGIKFASSISNYGSKLRMSGDDLLIRHDPDPQRAGNNQTLDAYYKTDEFELPLRLQVGLSRDFIIMDQHRLTLAVDAVHPNDNNQWVNIGGEISLFDNLISLRGGYKSLFLKDTQEGLTLGAGINYGGLGVFRISVDYSYEKMEYLDHLHSFGIVIGF
ncbi:MAG TPA: PorV/PorQ family protein [Melioribacteraceae bacterium]|nr:PorV/PorQ family protein [Melioribacteraceae bacterium]